jgi:hypothetical protein
MGVSCPSFIRLLHGGFRADDLCHTVLYRHPRSDHFCLDEPNLLKPFVIFDGRRGLEAQEQFHGQGSFPYLFHGDDYYGKVSEPTVSDFEAELATNGFGSCLKIPSHPLTSFANLGDVALRKLVHERHRQLPNPLSYAEMLAVLCYTGTDAQMDLRRSMLEGKALESWPFFSRLMRVAIAKLSRDPTPRRPKTVYHGLRNVSFRDVIRMETTFASSFCGCVYPALVSTSCQRGVSLAMAAAGVSSKIGAKRGMLLKINLQMSTTDEICADVSWISKFPSEDEVVIAPFGLLLLENTRFDASDTEKEKSRKIEMGVKEDVKWVEEDILLFGNMQRIGIQEVSMRLYGESRWLAEW